MSDAPPKISFTGMVLLGVNGIIGSGIFLLPGQVMSLVGQWGVLVYLFVAFLVFTIAWCFADCAALFSRNGGAYVYAKEAFGSFIGFEIGIIRWAASMIAWATMTAGFTTALSSLWPSAMAEPYRILIVIALTCGLGIVNMLGINWIQPLNNVVTVAKFLPLLFFIALGLAYLNPTEILPPTFIDPDGNEGAFGAAALLIFYAFAGFENLVVAAGEMENPKKNLPLALMAVVGFCSLTYIFIQITAMSLLGENLAGSSTPISDASQVMLGGFGKWFVLIAMLISIGGINVASSFTAPRNGEALAQDSLLPEWMAYRGSRGTPVAAIAVTMLLTCLIALFGSFAQLATISVIARFVQYISTCLAAIVFYRKKWSWFSFAVPAIALMGMSWLLMQASASQLYLGLGSLVLGIPLYFLQTRGNREEEQSAQEA